MRRLSASSKLVNLLPTEGGGMTQTFFRLQGKVWNKRNRWAGKDGGTRTLYVGLACSHSDPHLTD